MADFLDDLSVYNAKASLVISQVVADGDTGKANMMSSLKTTANDTTLSDAIRLNALTALINLGSLLDIPLPPYFPIVTTYANTQTYVGIHNDLSGIQGGVPGEYYHLTLAERTLALNAATQADINFANLSGVYSDNASLVTAFQGKQNALSGTGFVRISGTTISYDNSTYLTTISGIAAGGELSGTYPNPALSNAAVISKVLTGFTGVALPTPITSSDTILSAMQKLNNNISSLIVSPSGVASVALTTNAGSVFTTTTSPQTGAATLNISLNSQSANLFLASPNGSSGTPSFRAFVAADLPNSGATAGTYGSSSFIPQIVVDAKGRITSISSVSAAAGGQVNTVTLTQPGIFGAVTNIGTASNVNLNYGLSLQTANYVWAGPISGANAVPGFRALVVADIPDLPTTKITGLDAQLSGFLTDSLSDGSIWIGNTSNAAVQRVLSGDVTVSNTGVTAIGLAKVQYDMIQDVTTQTLLGRYDAVDGEVQQVTLSGDFLLNSSTGILSLSSPVSPVVSTKGDLLGHDLTAQQRVPSSNVDGDILLVNNSATGAYTDLGLNWVTMSGDATIAASGAITIGAGAVTLGKMATLANNRIIGNVSGGPLAPSALTGTQVTGMLDLFSTSVQGVVPAATNTAYFLRGDGSWQPITGTGTVTAVSIATANGFAGTSSGGATPALTITLNSLNGVLKGTGTAIAAATAGTGGDYISPGQITQISGAGSGLTMASGSLLGRTTASAGVIEAISVNSSLTLASTALGLNLGNGNIFTVQQQMPSIRLNGSTSGFVSFTPPAVAGAQVYELPAAAPSAGTTRFLTSTDGGVLSWQIPAGSGTTTNAITFNNGGSGDASGTTFNGSAARTISYNTIGAQLSNANLTGLSALSYASGTPLVRMTAAGTFSLDNGTYLAGTATQYAVLVGGAGNSVSPLPTSAPNKLLISNGVSTNPGWTSASYLDTTTQYGILYSNNTNSVSEILPPGTSGLFLQWTGSGYTWAAGGGGGGSGTVSTGTIGQLAYYTGTTTVGSFSAANSIIYNNNTNIVAALPFGTEANKYLRVNSGGTGLVWDTVGGGTVTSVGLTMPSAFNVSVPNPITTSGTFAVTGAGTISQYIRGDGTLGIFPSIGGGGGGSVYYMNGGVTASPSTIGGVAMYQLSKAPITAGASVDFTANTNGATIASFLTDTGDPNQTSIPAGIWIFECYLSAAGSGSAHPTVEAVIEKWDGTTLSVIATGPAEEITNGTTKDLYQFAATIPTGITISATDRIVVQIKVVDAASKTITLYTQNGNVSSVTTTFPNAIVSLNSLTAGTQLFANGSSGTAPAFVSATDTHTLNIPLASASSVTAGLISKTEYDTFNGKLANVLTTTGDIIYSSSGTTAARLGIGTANQVLAVSAGLVPEWKTISGTGDVVGPAGAVTNGNFAVFDTSGQIIKESVAASLSAAGAAVFNSSVTVGVSGAAPTGQLIFRNSSNAFTTTFQSSTSQSANANYTWPQAQAASAGLVLTNDGAGNLSWTATGTGNVTLAGNNTFTGTNSFSNQVTINGFFTGGTFRIQNPGTTGYTQLVSAASTGQTRVFTFPDITAGTVAVTNVGQTFSGAQVIGTTGTFTLSAPSTLGTTRLVSDALGTNAWIATFPNTSGIVAYSNFSGQIFSGAQNFSGAVTISPGGSFKISTALSSGTTTLATNASGTNALTATFPDASGIVPLLGLSQNWGALQTFQAGLTVSVGASTFSAAGSPTVAQINLTPSSGNSNWIDFAIGAGGAAPSTVTRSTGSRIVFGKWVAANSLDTGMGYNAGELWFSTLNTTYNISFYAASGSGGTTIRYGRFNGNGLTLDAIPSATVSNLLVSAPSGTRGAWMNFGTIGEAAPTTTTSRSVGTKIVLRPFFTSGSETDFAIGYNTGDLWLSSASTSYTISMYGGATRVAWFSGAANVGLTFADGYNIVFNATTGTKIATATTQKLAFWNKTPIVQPTTSITGATRVGGAGTTVTTTDTYGGYTLAQIAAALVNTGILA